MSKLFENLKKDKKALWIMLIGVAVMLIIMGTEFVPGGKSKKKHSDAESPSIGDYESILEDKLTDLLASVSGAGRTKVMVTLDRTEEYVYIYDESKEEEIKGDGGTAKSSTKTSYIIIEDGKSSGESGLKSVIIMPKVKGVAVVCEGGDIPSVKQQINEIVTSVFDIPSTKVSIAKMKQK
ncbi:MAG: hypothetical protein GXY95_02135 [Clostridiales bacterium]|nr:hypothetical protein [Clostridiales bacterium]HOA34255.1 hypothetical protein [Clostridiales bacterium]HOJ36102.1 hypothetical protein [Clostridiales bacterium]HPP67623.1 hypothetical protein [Clostridiales bacterium]HPU66756.1 hypothetical protein [Clostridiales bacterium]